MIRRITLALVLMLAANAGAEPNYWALQPGAHDPSRLDPPRAGRLITLQQLQLDAVGGLTIRSRSHWPLSWTVSCVATARKAGDRYTLLPMGGEDSQPWLPAAVLKREKWLDALSKEFAADPLCWGVHVLMPPKGVSEEPHWSPRMPAKAEQALKASVSYAAQKFPRQKLLLAISLKDVPAMRRIIDYATAVAPGRVVVKHNAGSAKMQITAQHNELLVYAAKQGADIGFEMLCDSKDSARFGGSWAQGVAKMDAVAKRAGKKAIYIAVYPTDLKNLR